MLEQWGISLMSSWISYNVGKENNIPARKRVGPKRVSSTPLLRTGTDPVAEE